VHLAAPSSDSCHLFCHSLSPLSFLVPPLCLSPSPSSSSPPCSPRHSRRRAKLGTFSLPLLIYSSPPQTQQRHQSLLVRLPVLQCVLNPRSTLSSSPTYQASTASVAVATSVRPFYPPRCADPKQYCLGGCNPLSSYSLTSCLPSPVCQNANVRTST